MQVHIFCIVREQPGGIDGKERLKQALQKFKLLPLTSDRQQMTEEERYLDYGFEHRVTVVKGDLYFLVNVWLWNYCRKSLQHQIFLLVYAICFSNH